MPRVSISKDPRFILFRKLERRFKFKERYGRRPVKIRFAGQGSVAYTSSWEVRIGGSQSSMVSTIHEFAHFLEKVRGSDPKRPHGSKFFDALCDSILAAGMKLKEYPWHTEYYTVYVAAKKDGYSDKPHSWYTKSQDTVESNDQGSEPSLPTLV